MTTPDPAEPRTLAGILEDASRARCGHCWAEPRQPCDTALPGGMHVARLGRAARRGAISSADFMQAMDALTVFTPASVLYETTGATT